MAKGYWIVRVDVSDPEAYKAYVAANAAAFHKFGAHFLVRGGKYATVEGASREFASLRDVRPGECESAGRTYEAPCRTCEARPRCLGIQTAYVEVHGDRGLRAIKLPPGANPSRS